MAKAKKKQKRNKKKKGKIVCLLVSWFICFPRSAADAVSVAILKLELSQVPELPSSFSLHYFNIICTMSVLEERKNDCQIPNEATHPRRRWRCRSRQRTRGNFVSSSSSYATVVCQPSRKTQLCTQLWWWPCSHDTHTHSRLTDSFSTRLHFLFRFNFGNLMFVPIVPLMSFFLSPIRTSINSNRRGWEEAGVVRHTAHLLMVTLFRQENFLHLLWHPGSYQ